MGIDNINWEPFKRSQNSVEEDIAYRVAKQISDQVDKDVLWDIYYKDCFPYTILDMGSDLIIDRDQWLRSNIGKKGDQWDYHRGTFYFKHQTDLVWFILKWS